MKIQHSMLTFRPVSKNDHVRILGLLCLAAIVINASMIDSRIHSEEENVLNQTIPYRLPMLQRPEQTYVDEDTDDYYAQQALMAGDEPTNAYSINIINDAVTQEDISATVEAQTRIIAINLWLAKKQVAIAQEILRMWQVAQDRQSEPPRDAQTWSAEIGN